MIAQVLPKITVACGRKESRRRAEQVEIWMKGTQPHSQGKGHRPSASGFLAIGWAKGIHPSTAGWQGADTANSQHWSLKVKVRVAQPFLTLCNPMDCSPWNSPGQNIGVGSFLFSQGSSQPKDQTQVSCIAAGFFTN